MSAQLSRHDARIHCCSSGRDTLQQTASQLDEIPVPLEECTALVERVAASEDFRRASRLRDFLLYVSAQTLERGAAGLHEQEIGEAVFGRPRAYDTSVDNIVRVNATGLRKRLENYFAEEGAQEPVIVEIPRGGYAPIFRRRTTLTGLTGTGPERPAAPPAETRPLRIVPEREAAAIPVAPPVKLSPRWWQAATALLAIACAVLLWQNRALDRQLDRWKGEPALRRFWGAFFQSGGQTDVVLADTSFSVAEDIMQRTVSLSDYMNYSYRRFADAPNLSADQRADLQLILARNNGSVGDFRVAQQVLSLNADPQRVSLKFAREYTTDAAKHDSMVLIGSQESNPWVGLFADKLNFQLQYDPKLHLPTVINRAPQPGEAASYAASAGIPSSSFGYCVIAYLPNMNGKGKTLILEGTDSQATAAAGEFVTTEDSLAGFEGKFGSGPVPSFEILLRTSQLSGTPLHAEIAAFRIYGNARSTGSGKSSR